MQAYRKSERTTPLILNLSTRRRRAVNFTLRPLYPRERTPVPIELKSGQTPEPVLIFSRTEISLVSKYFYLTFVVLSKDV
jgi:hypothetical protein